MTGPNILMTPVVKNMDALAVDIVGVVVTTVWGLFPDSIMYIVFHSVKI